MERRELGGGAPLSATAGVASAIFVRDNPSRKKIIIGNDSDSVIYLSQSNQAVLNKGIPLRVGAVLIDEPDIFGRIYTGVWSAISLAGSKNLAYLEVR